MTRKKAGEKAGVHGTCRTSQNVRVPRLDNHYTARVFGVSCVRAIQRAPYCPDHDLLVAVTKQEPQNSDYTLGILLGTL